MTSKIKVLVVDDSAFMRKVVSELLEEHEDVKVIDRARNGIDALRKLEKYTPDVITLDVEMPKMDGIEFLRRLMEKKPIPVVMLSSLTYEGSEATIEALELGAFDFVPKPSGAISLDIEEVEDNLIEKIRLAAQTGVKRRLKRQVKRDKKSKFQPKKETAVPKSKGEVKKKIVLIGASTGGPRALKEVFTRLPGNLALPILVVQHMPSGFTYSLANRLNKLSKFEVKEAEEGDKLRKGLALVAPGDYHMVIKKKKVKLTKGSKMHNVRPAIDKTIESIVEEYGEGIVGVLLTGMGRDGAEGLKLIKEQGGSTIAQDENTSVVYGMPKTAYNLGAVDKVKPIQQIADEIVNMIYNN